MSTMRRLLLPVCLVAVACAPAYAQNEPELTLRIVSATYTRGDQVITADFVEGVLVKYSISSK